MRRRKPRARAGLAAAAAILTVGAIVSPSGIPAPEAWAQSNDTTTTRRSDLKKIEQGIRRRRDRGTRLDWRHRALARDIRKLRRDLMRSARYAQRYETELFALEAEIKKLVSRERIRRQAFGQKQAQMARILAALERISLYPPETLIAMPGGPNETVRSAILLRALVPQLERRAAILRGELRAMATLRAKIEDRHRRLRAANQALATRRKELAALIARQNGLLRSTAEERRELKKQIADLAGKAKTLRELMARLDDGRKRRVGRPPERPSTRTAMLTRPKALRRFSAARGKLTLPVAGPITTLYGEKDRVGDVSKGIELTGRLGAQVVAPYDGQIVFAAPFRGYGQILIIEHSEGYHTLIAGLARIDAAVKQWVLAGEPVGVMGGSGASAQRLYLEIRHKGRPINPLPWMAADRRKVKR